MGQTGTGKSTVCVYLHYPWVYSNSSLKFINQASGGNLEIDDGLESCTTEVQASSFTLHGKTITLIDTPGFDDTNMSETEVLRKIASHLEIAWVSYVVHSAFILTQPFSKLWRPGNSPHWNCIPTPNLGYEGGRSIPQELWYVPQIVWRQYTQKCCHYHNYVGSGWSRDGWYARATTTNRRQVFQARYRRRCKNGQAR